MLHACTHVHTCMMLPCHSTHMHTRTHTHIHTHTTHIHTQHHTHTHTFTHAHTTPHIHTHTHTHTHTTHSCTHTHTHTLTHTTHTQHTHTHSHTHTDARTHTHTPHTHTDTHTHTQCHVSSIPVYTDMRQRTFRSFIAVIIPSVLICFSVYTLTGVFGLLKFHPHPEGGVCIASDILRNYCPKDIVVDIARGMLAVVIVTSYPILTFCGR